MRKTYFFAPKGKVDLYMGSTYIELNTVSVIVLHAPTSTVASVKLSNNAK